MPQKGEERRQSGPERLAPWQYMAPGDFGKDKTAPRFVVPAEGAVVEELLGAALQHCIAVRVERLSTADRVRKGQAAAARALGMGGRSSVNDVVRGAAWMHLSVAAMLVEFYGQECWPEPGDVEELVKAARAAAQPHLPVRRHARRRTQPEATDGGAG